MLANIFNPQFVVLDTTKRLGGEGNYHWLETFLTLGMVLDIQTQNLKIQAFLFPLKR